MPAVVPLIAALAPALGAVFGGGSLVGSLLALGGSLILSDRDGDNQTILRSKP